MSDSGTIGSRISQILKAENLSENGLAVVLRKAITGYKVSHTTVKRYIDNDYPPKPVFYDALKEAFGYSKLWVQDGLGEPKLNTDMLKESGNFEQYWTTDENPSPGYNKEVKEDKAMTPTDFQRLQAAQERLKVAQEQMNFALAEITEITNKGITLTIKPDKKETRN